jgi:hypothetical protein
MRSVLLGLLLVAASLQSATASEGGHEESHEAHHFHPNFVGLFVGVALEDRRDNGLAVGLEYERRLNESFGIGGLAEYTFGDLDVWVLGVPFSWHIDNLKLAVAPGIENGDERGSEFLVRFGGEYAFDMGTWELAPQIDIDIVDGDTVFVLGAVFGFGF